MRHFIAIFPYYRTYTYKFAQLTVQLCTTSYTPLAQFKKTLIFAPEIQNKIMNRTRQTKLTRCSLAMIRAYEPDRDNEGIIPSLLMQIFFTINESFDTVQVLHPVYQLFSSLENPRKRKAPKKETKKINKS